MGKKKKYKYQSRSSRKSAIKKRMEREMIEAELAEYNKLPDFKFVPDFRERRTDVYYKDIKLEVSLEDGLVISRQHGFDLSTEVIKQLPFPICSAEEVRESNLEISYYHNRYFTFVYVDDDKIFCEVRYLDVPEGISFTDEVFKDMMKELVDSYSGLQLANDENDPNVMEQLLMREGFAVRPKIFNSFSIIFSPRGETYGEILLEVDDMILDLEDQAMNRLGDME